ncbi:7451_t:CDS:2 [Ambispora gerdemannii]|uniref:7451_t:CDS:1 n=1 Tax=Ambispora gerdemannii TaxID=144530 RepID=A0A9N9BD54_9GLOM|nr:7451_t:CDS:2 [Ambispora gerdemannii]
MSEHDCYRILFFQMSANIFDTGHEDLIHDVAFDFYGKRLATCSSDQRIKVWEHNSKMNSWETVDTWKAHDCSILKVTWAHPEFGQVLASCSFDRSVCIWEEQENEPRNSGRRFVQRARIQDSLKSVQDIEFAPNILGLKLAACAADGIVRIYEFLEVTNLEDYTCMDEFEINPGSITKEVDGHYCISWCPSRFNPPMMVVGCGKEAKIFRQDGQSKWQAYEVLSGHEDTVHDVSWAPTMGRLVSPHYFLFSEDQHVRIYKITSDRTRYLAELLCSFRDHNVEVWRVEWNVTGTILSSSGDDGKVRLWKAADGEWKCMSILSYDRQSEHSEM